MPIAGKIPPLVQRQNKEEEEEGKIQRQEDENEEEEAIQTKSSSGPRAVPAGLQNQLNSSRAKGTPLPKDTQTHMESAFGADFGHVRIHTNSDAAQMSQGINAQAFTHGSDIYFNQGKYDTGTSSGKKLLAHELTHVVQQGATSIAFRNESTQTLRRKPDKTEEAEANYIFKIKVTKKHSADEFLAITLSQISRKDISLVKKIIKQESWHWEVFDGISDEDVNRKFTEVIVPQSTYFHWTGILLGDVGVGEDPDELLEQYSELTKTILELPKEEQKWLNKETDKRFWEATGYKPGTKLKPKKSKQDAAMAELWLAIRQQLLLELQEKHLEFPEKKEEQGPTEEINSDWKVLENSIIAKHYIKMLEHYARISMSDADKKAASDGLSEEEILNIIGERSLPHRLTDLYTQGYREFEAAGGSDATHFFILETTIIEQYRLGNSTAIRNQLKIGYGQPERDILGIVHRPDGTLYYNRLGQPLRSIVGTTYRDPNYVGSKIGAEVKEKVEDIAKWASIDLSILSIDDPALRLVFQVIRQSVSEPLMMTAHAADVYMNNIEAVNKEVSKGLSDEVVKALGDMIIPLIGFLAGQGVAHFLMMSGVPVLVLAGGALKGLLQAAGYLLSIQSGAEAMQRLLDAAFYLTRVEENEKGKLTELSQSHLKSAAEPLQKMVTEIVISAATLSLSKALKSGQRLKLECTNPCKLKGVKIPRSLKYLEGFATAENIATIQNILKKTGVNAKHRGLREYLLINRNDLTAALNKIKLITTKKGLESRLDDFIRDYGKARGGKARKRGDGLWEISMRGRVVVEYEVAGFSKGGYEFLRAKRGSNNFFQAHHGIQGSWGKNRPGIKDYFSYEECPAILLRDSRKGSPHQIINGRQDARSAGKTKRTYVDELNEMKKDLRAGGVPKSIIDEMVVANNRYFSLIYKDMKADGYTQKQLDSIFGNWQP